ncbi:Uncharacterised protein [BD1-7 clade bacterium]|uniref:DUF2269 domain-containing protein n=1 Tax=BD1-7 clade bacterium TaxID=2029982 RepID=A0A5S9Q5J0_9GAMM|nr:Uncharacterised protein [BD1-7 clade bacterium]CAA0113063.1 Uncharacterised protein [BD1-7 clade bacterium]
MEAFIDTTNLKSIITFIHIAGLAMGVGGAWILDAMLLKDLKDQVLTSERYDVIQFVSNIVISGLCLLWLSGLAFVAFYYFYQPEYLGNEKVWAKMAIVFILSLNGFLVHTYVLPELKRAIGSALFDVLPDKKITPIIAVGVTSFISWMFPIVLGVSKSLNFSTPAWQIISFYLAILTATLGFTHIIFHRYIMLEKKPQPISFE